MGTAPFKTEIAKRTKAFTDVWTAIEEHVQAEPHLSLRDAANIIGFRSFPVGWTWTEYKPQKSATEPSYEAKAQRASRLGGPLPSNPSPEGLIAMESAILFRSKAARKILYHITSRASVPIRIYNADGYGRVAGDRELLDQTLQFNIANGSVSLHGYNERAEIDGPKLVEYLNRQTASWEKRLGKHDWLLAERLARDVFEVHGCHFSDQEIIRQCRDQYSNIHENAPFLDQSGYTSRVSVLRREYSPSDE